MTNQPPSSLDPKSPSSAEAPLGVLLRQISLDWWAVLTALVLAVLVLVGLNIPW